MFTKYIAQKCSVTKSRFIRTPSILYRVVNFYKVKYYINPSPLQTFSYTQTHIHIRLRTYPHTHTHTHALIITHTDRPN